MKRRNVLVGVGAVGATGLLHSLRKRDSRVTVAVYFSSGAWEYDGLPTLIEGYLSNALLEAFGSVDVRFGDAPVSLPAEEGREVMTEVWPRLVLEGVVDRGPVTGVEDVNLLVTDGDPSSEPAGYGLRRIAAITGAKVLSEMPPADETPDVLARSVPATVVQLLLHECGHALGLEHDHGAVREGEDAIVATPMVGGYAWSSSDRATRLRSRETNACGRPYPEPSADGKRRCLSLKYSACAHRALG